ncbi:hypothetical protein RJ640_004708 [Escallonia rubra]|uniref:tetraacyldisaccharide 4'-kinase n=1 Tax=Escallonia rubra TaxID=112253 RepID=A0AA88ULV2_9ASTE|nr:hypothetical protein RJ640_004708 [Escallonia rubra]
MEKLRRAVNQIAYTPRSQRLATLSPLQLSLIPLLSLASSLFKLALSFRHQLHHFGLLRKNRLPVPVISVGNLTWGGNGKTPMVEFIALWLANSGISPLILTRGYGGADEARMLRRHLDGTSAKIGVGADRAATAACFIDRYGHINGLSVSSFERLCYEHDRDAGSHLDSDKIGVAILDDGMQHLSLWRDLEIVMVNGMMPWGNHQLLPLGPLREPLSALSRADIIVVHHADLVSEQNMKLIESTIREVTKSLPIYSTRMTPLYFFKVGTSFKLSLEATHNMIVLCVSAIGFADSFVRRIEKGDLLQMRPLHVDRLDFSDHHLLQTEDIDMIRVILQKLQAKFAAKPVVIVTEKDYDRDPEILGHLEPFEVWVLCSKLQVITQKGCSGDSFMKTMRRVLEVHDHV